MTKTQRTNPVIIKINIEMTYDECYFLESHLDHVYDSVNVEEYPNIKVNRLLFKKVAQLIRHEMIRQISNETIKE